MLNRVRVITGLLVLMLAPMLLTALGARPATAHYVGIHQGTDYGAVLSHDGTVAEVEICDYEADGHNVKIELRALSREGWEYGREWDSSDLFCDYEVLVGAHTWRDARVCEHRKNAPNVGTEWVPI